MQVMTAPDAAELIRLADDGCPHAGDTDPCLDTGCPA